MATDQSLPRHRLIFVMAIGTLVSLFGLKYLLDSYFTEMFESEAAARIAKPEELWKLHDDEAKRLTQSPLPIDQAMQQIGRGREASPVIAPEQSTDTAPLVGWAKGTRAQTAAGGGEDAGTGAADTQLAPLREGAAVAGATSGPNPGEPAVGTDGGAVPHIADAGSMLTLRDGGKLDPTPVRRGPTNGPVGTVQPGANVGGGQR